MRMIEYFVDVAKECINIGNFNSLMAIIGKNYRSGTVNSNTVNSKFHLIRSCCEYLARFLSFHV